ncbi:MAG: OmpA family protein [Hyphomicrobiaceae bacterium]|nr:OmpA family protein [Hyphomicrobiaceae bacterium]
MTSSNRFRLGALALILVLGVAPLSGWSQTSVTTLYGWSATNISGKIEMDGALPTEGLKNFLNIRSGGFAEDTTRISEGAPEHFSQDAIAGVTVLRHFERGRVAYTGSGWSLTGILMADKRVDDVLNELSSLTDASNWTIEISDAPVGPPAPAAVAQQNVETADPAPAVAPAEIDTTELPELGIGDESPLFVEDLAAGELPPLTLNAGLPKFETAEAMEPVADVTQTAETSVAQPQSDAQGSTEASGSPVPLTDDQLPALTLDAGLPRFDAVPEANSTPEVAGKPIVYQWSASNLGGVLTFSGDVPTDGLRRYLLVRAGEGAVDGMAVVAGAPEGFVDATLAAMDPVLALDESEVSFDGQAWTFSGRADTEDTIDAVARLLDANDLTKDWKRDLSVRPVSLTVTKAPDGEIELAGLLPADALKSYLRVISGGGNVDGIRIGGTSNPDFVSSAAAGVRALTNLETGELKFDGSRWSLEGKSLTDLDASSAKSLVAALPNGGDWAMNITQAPLFDICSRAVTAFSNTHTILFAPASARIEADSRNQLSDLAGELLKCPEADLYVEGHTDADGPAEANMALSVARAEAVIEELIGLGVSYTRLYAVGYGETLPIASNETREGKALNRRIVFELVRQQ